MTASNDKSHIIEPALALLEYSSIAAGIEAADAMVKRAEVDVVQAGTVQPGNLLVLLGGPVAEVEEALKAGLPVAADALLDHIFLPAVDPAVVRALAAQRDTRALELASTAVGMIETRTVPAAIRAADAAVKGADVTLMEMRLADGLGGKGIVFLTGDVSDMEAALEITAALLTDAQKVRQVVIPQLHGDIAGIINRNSRFGVQLAWRFYRNDNFRGE
ncbi:MAG: propanediol utilization protein [Anaerolineaceae bacterium]|nr:propanediol utilization protein [Anaerolineaceae bacterium]